jgi:hypothetical protein
MTSGVPQAAARNGPGFHFGNNRRLWACLYGTESPKFLDEARSDKPCLVCNRALAKQTKSVAGLSDREAGDGSHLRWMDSGHFQGNI